MDVDKIELGIKETRAGFVVIDFSESVRRIGSPLVFANSIRKSQRIGKEGTSGEDSGPVVLAALTRLSSSLPFWCWFLQRSSASFEVGTRFTSSRESWAPGR